jgi:DNA-directed RNA polymerase II subunit RPB2
MGSIEWTDEDAWKVVDKYMYHAGNVQWIAHQIESFDDAIENKIPHIIRTSGPFCITEDDETQNIQVEVNFGDLHISKPTIFELDGSKSAMFPNEARLRSFTYASPMTIDITINLTYRNKVTGATDSLTKTMNSVSIGKMPIMLRSKFCLLNDYPHIHPKELGECEYDYGGYFIINGGERVIMSQERISENRVYVFAANKSGKTTYNSDIKSVPIGDFNNPKTITVKFSPKNGSEKQLRVYVQKIRTEIPLTTLFRALGVTSDRDILNAIVYDCEDPKNRRYVDFLLETLENHGDIYTKEDAIAYISRYVTTWQVPGQVYEKGWYVEQILSTELYPHIGSTPGDVKAKAYFLGYMTRKLLACYFGDQPYDDRDSYINKRLDLPGALISSLFKQYWNMKLLKDMRSAIQSEIKKGSWRAATNLDDIINPTNISKIIKSTTIETGIKYALATGNFGMKNTQTKVGISQVLSRLNYISMVSHLRRVTTPIDKTAKLIAPRKLHPTQWGFVCPNETPEGHSIGVIKNLALTCVVTVAVSPYPVIRMLLPLITGWDAIGSAADLIGKTRISVNGNWIGITTDPANLVAQMRSWKRQGIWNIYTGIHWDTAKNEIWVQCDGGRYMRPVLIVDRDESGKNTLRITRKELEDGVKWSDLLIGRTRGEIDSAIESTDSSGAASASIINPSGATSRTKGRKKGKNAKAGVCSDEGDRASPLERDRASPLERDRTSPLEGCIEFIDALETEGCLIATKASDLSDNPDFRYTHCEIHPSLILGTVTSCIPFANHNQSPRNTYQTSMGKQAMGVFATNYLSRMDTMGNILTYPQRPITYTRNSLYFHSNDIPSGINAVVAIATYSGYNQEDSVILNRGAVDRGLFRSFFYRTYKDEEKKNPSSGEEERFLRPDFRLTKGIKYGSYDKLAEDGFVPINTFVDNNDIVIGKITPIKNPGVQDKGKVYRDQSKTLRPNECGFVDKIHKSRNGDGYSFCKVRVRTERIPVVGDKFASRSAQKGSCGLILAHEDMPMTACGITPDIIMNPHAIPSRMTIGQVIECVAGKMGSLKGTYCDATPFNEIDVNDLGDILESTGFERWGNEILYNGMTGQMMQTAIFIGPTYYQRLKHMVEDKIHSRASGPVVMLTRQPAEGRLREGGLRYGEMEREAMIAHGAACFNKERMHDVSDAYVTQICKACGCIAACNPSKGIFICKGCTNKTQFAEVSIPFAYKLLVQELETMNIASRFITK